MQNVPSTAELVEAVAEWLEGAAGAALTGAERYNARVAANVLRSVERELRAGPGHHDPDWAALAQYLPVPAPEDDTALVVALAEKVRSGELDSRRAELLGDLRAYTRRKLVLTNPRYLAADDRTPAGATTKEA